MQLEQLRYFKCLAENKSITQASKGLYISQQALSTSIRKLEEELTVKLFERTSRGVILTLDGEYLLKEVTKMFNDLEKIKLHFLNKDSLVQFNIGAISIAKKFLLSKSMSYFYKNFPQIKLDVQSASTPDIIKGVLSEKYDLGYISTLTINNQEYTKILPEINFTPIHILPFYVEMHKDHPLKKYKKIPISELAKYQALVLDVDKTESYLPKMLSELFGITSVIEADNEVLYARLLEDGVGYSLMTDLGNENGGHYSAQLIHRPLEEDVLSIIGSVKKANKEDKDFYIELFCNHLQI